MFRIGDIVNNFHVLCDDCRQLPEDSYTVTAIHEEGYIQVNSMGYWWANSCFILFKKKDLPKNELEWLDRIKENFS